MDRMSAIERLKSRGRQDAAYRAIANRIALEQALRDEIDEEVWGEIRVENSSNGKVASIGIEGHSTIRAMCHVGENGIGWFLTFWIMTGDSPRLCQTFLDAVTLAETQS